LKSTYIYLLKLTILCIVGKAEMSRVILEPMDKQISRFKMGKNPLAELDRLENELHVNFSPSFIF